MNKNHRRIIFVALAAFALAITGYWLFAPRDPEVATLIIKKAPADRVLAVNGRIRPRLQVDIRPSLGGRNPIISFIRLDLPQPDPPRITNTSPASTWNVTS